MSGNTLDDVVKRLGAADTGTKASPLHGHVSLPPSWQTLCCACRSQLIKLKTNKQFIDPKIKADTAATLRDSLDHYTTGPTYVPFLKKVMPVFIGILKGPCIFQSNSQEQVRE